MDIQLLAQLPFWFTSLIVFLIGLAVGSFVNVVIYRVPREMSIVRPGSHCPQCSVSLRIQDNIPLLSFLWLQARCRSCGGRIPIRYPVVELIVGTLFWIVWRANGVSWSLLLDWSFVSAMVALAMIDLEHRLLPDWITYPGFVLAVGLRSFVPQEPSWFWTGVFGDRNWVIGAGLIASSGFIMLAIEHLDYHFVGRRLEELEEAMVSSEAKAILNESSAPTGDEALEVSAPTEQVPASLEIPPPSGHHLELVTVLLGLALAGLFLLMISSSSPGDSLTGNTRVDAVMGGMAGAALGAGMIWGLRIVYFVLRNLEGVGFGDVKMMMMVGAYLGWSRAFLTLLLASVLGSLVGVVMMIRYRDRFVGLPYGLFIAVAAIVALLAGTPLVGWYWVHGGLDNSLSQRLFCA